MESLVAVENGLADVSEADVMVSHITTAVGTVEPCAVIPSVPVPAQPGAEWARTGGRPKAPVLTSTPILTSLWMEPSWSEVVCGSDITKSSGTVRLLYRSA